MAIESATIVTLYDDAAKTKAFAPRTKVSAISNDNGTDLQTLLDGKMSSKPTFIEFGASADSSLNEGYIDWHWNGSNADYTSRLIESSSGTLSVNGVTFNNNKITSGTWNGSAIGAAYGGTGKTSLVDSANTLINSLSTGSSTPQDADYYISQYVGGGSTTTTYHRRPMSALWTYIKGKADSTYSASDHTHPYVSTNRGADQNCGTTGYWAAMSTQHGIDSNWRHILNMDWSGNDNKNWISQMSFPTIPGQGMLYRCNGNEGKAITDYGWTTVLDSANYTSYTIPKTGGTFTGSVGVAGDLVVGGPIRIHAATGSSGTAGYIKFASIKITETYVNAPIMFLIGQRGKSATCFCWVQFQNANSTDPGLSSFKHLAWGSNYSLYIVKSATSTWDLYIAKSENYDRMGVSFHFSSQTGYSITYTNTQVSTPPSGYVQSTLVCQTTSFVSSSQPTAISTGDIWFVI